MADKYIKPFLKSIYLPVISILVSFGAGFLFMLLIGYPVSQAAKAYMALVKGSFGSLKIIGETLVYSTPLIFTGLALSAAFRCGLFNIGAEGQFIIGSFTAVWAGFALEGLPWFLHVPACLIAGAAGGAIWAAVIGILKAKLGCHEVINSIMLNYVAWYLSNFLSLKIPYFNMPSKAFTKDIADTAKLYPLFQNSRLTAGIFIAILCAVILYIILWKTVLGYEIRAVGNNPAAAEYGGISVSRNLVLAMILSGALAGMGGAVQVQSVNFRVNQLLSFTNYGLDGVAVALVGKQHPFGVVFGAILFGALAKGSFQMQFSAGVPKEVVGLIQGIIIVFIAAEQIFLFFNKRKGAVS
ncbi:beta-methylgalactoside transporter inner membrane component [Oxobacter pfennigii]|uniref:Beta-methylgalactoside transporter inner membrane component n=1 Tax=Oxobacter pfennigii TaxID=36849 RepID=A0A0N8NTM7_9CLOT|nr:ABC transporter permease [Oxobacter pfennigii]KPU45264.1 beta-methylgalactoside transporter inner membrane component [Oxobacter pfennigii]